MNFGTIPQRVRIQYLLRLEYWLRIRMRGGDQLAELERKELKKGLDKRGGQCPLTARPPQPVRSAAKDSK